MRQLTFKKSEPVVFRRWNNSRFAVFNSLKRTIVIGCLLVAYLKFANPVAFASSIDTTSVVKDLQLESIDVSADQLPETFSNLSRVVVTITQKEIERAAVTSLNELLEYASNIDIRQRGADGVQADISIRGSTFDQVLILLNGVNITDPQTGHHNLNLPLDLSAIERIEIVKGPGSWKFGPGAFGGAINFITKKSETPFIQVGIEGGENLFHQENLSGGFRTGKLNHFISAKYSSSDGYTSNTDFNLANLFYQGSIATNITELSLQAGYTDKKFGANSFYSPKYPEQFEATQTLFTSIGAKTMSGKFHIEPKIYFRRNNDKFLLFRSNPALYSNYHTTDVWGSNLLVSYFHNSKSVTSVGFDTRTETIWSNRLGELSERKVFSPVNDTILLNYFHSRSNFSSFIGQKWYFSDFILNVGLNFTRNTDQNFKWFIYPGIDLSYNLSANSSLLASVNKTMRMPTFTDLYYSGPVNKGNPFLLPEEAVGYEFGYQFKGQYLNVSASAFYSEGKNLIDWVKQDLNDVWHTVNHSQISTMGAEFSMQASLDKILPNQKFLKRLKIDYTYLHQDKPETNLISNYSLSYLKQRVDINFSHAIIRNFSVDWHFSYQDRNGQYEKFADKVSQGLAEYDPFFLCDMKISYQNAGWSVYGMVNNLFNHTYFDIGNIAQPGRWIKIGVVKKFGFR
jgi:iron complex outermembrane receptor protein